MARQSKMVREQRLWKQEPSARRQEIKQALKHAKINDPGKVFDLMLALQKRPLNESTVRKVRRCMLCGRSKGVYRMFNMCRCCIRKNMSNGLIPGYVKSS